MAAAKDTAKAVLAARERPGACCAYWIEPQPLLLDTHALLWWLLDDAQLSVAARAAISETRRRVGVSSVSAWEIEMKYQLGKLPQARDIVDNLDGYLRKERFEVLAVRPDDQLSSSASANACTIGPTTRINTCERMHGARLKFPLN